MSTSIKIPMVEPDENVGILDEENQEKSLEQKQHEIYGLTIAEYDGIDKLFTMLTPRGNAYVRGDEYTNSVQRAKKAKGFFQFSKKEKKETAHISGKQNEESF